MIHTTGVGRDSYGERGCNLRRGRRGGRSRNGGSDAQKSNKPSTHRIKAKSNLNSFLTLPTNHTRQSLIDRQRISHMVVRHPNYLIPRNDRYELYIIFF